MYFYAGWWGLSSFSFEIKAVISIYRGGVTDDCMRKLREEKVFDVISMSSTTWRRSIGAAYENTQWFLDLHHQAEVEVFLGEGYAFRSVEDSLFSSRSPTVRNQYESDLTRKFNKSWKYVEQILNFNNYILPILNNIIATYVRHLTAVLAYVHDGWLNTETQQFWL